MEAYHDPLHGGLRELLRRLDLEGGLIDMVLAGLPGEALVVATTGIGILKAGYQATGVLFRRQARFLRYDQVEGVEVHVSKRYGRFVVVPARPHQDTSRAWKPVVHFSFVLRDKFRLAARIVDKRLAGWGQKSASSPAAAMPARARAEPLGQIAASLERRAVESPRSVEDAPAVCTSPTESGHAPASLAWLGPPTAGTRIPATDGSPRDPIDQLVLLADLHARHALSDEEFRAAKREILKRLE